MLLIGHRGCKYPGYNQNTIRSFEKVTSEGVPAIEFDVQLSSDGELVVVHNLDLEEVSTGTGEVSSTDSETLKGLYAGDPERGLDRIPFLVEVFDFFASKDPGVRPVIQMELKGAETGTKAGELFNEYVDEGRLKVSDMLASSFNWEELKAFREVCPTAKIALLDGAIRRTVFLEKTGPEGLELFGDIFAYGNEEYMMPRFPGPIDNQVIIEEKCADPRLRSLLSQEVRTCLAGGYYTDALLDTSASGIAALPGSSWRRPTPGG